MKWINYGKEQLRKLSQRLRKQPQKTPAPKAAATVKPTKTAKSNVKKVESLPTEAKKAAAKQGHTSLNKGSDLGKNVTQTPTNSGLPKTNASGSSSNWDPRIPSQYGKGKSKGKGRSL